MSARWLGVVFCGLLVAACGADPAAAPGTGNSVDPECSDHGDCAEGVCISGACVVLCANHEDCAQPGEICRDFLCMAVTSTECPDADTDGISTCAGDCNDSDNTVHPGVAEVGCDTIDNDCNDATLD